MKLIRRWYWIVTAFLSKYAIILVLASIAGSVLVMASGRFQSVVSFKPETRIGRIGTISLSQLPIDIQELISRGLTMVNQDGTTTADVANTISTSEDGKTYTITIDPNAFWSDNTKLSSDQIDINIKDATIERPSDEVIKISLQEPFLPLKHVISQPILKRIQVGTFNKKTTIIGLNKFSIKNLETQNQVIKELKLESPTNTIHYFFYPTEEDAITAFKLGKIDKIEFLNQVPINDWPNIQVETITNPYRYTALFLNTTDPNLQDKTIRQMLAYATPKPTDETRVISPISRESWVYNPQVKPYDYNPQVAKDMLNKLQAANQNLNPSFTITTTPLFQNLAQEISSAWQEVGIKTDLRIVAFPDTNDYQVLLIGQQIPKEPDQYALWHSTQASNITKYQNPKIDKLLEDGRRELDPDTRMRIYQDFQRFLVEDSPAIFLSNIHTYHIIRD